MGTEGSNDGSLCAAAHQKVVKIEALNPGAPMTSWFEAAVASLLGWLSLSSVGLPAVFVVSLVSATLVPMGSEPAVWALVKLRPDLFWPAVGVATLGNTLGGAISWWMGLAAARARQAWRQRAVPGADSAPNPARPNPARLASHHPRAQAWLLRWGPAACLLSWLPVVGDPLCAVAGWLRLPFWPCVFYMAVGKALRYITLTALLTRCC
jgi:membrane protein YqaA with SNARE-associated domain